MIGYDYPTVYRCAKCDAKISIGRRELRDVTPNPEEGIQHEVTLQKCGWIQARTGDSFVCPSCSPEDVGDPKAGRERDSGIRRKDRPTMFF